MPQLPFGQDCARAVGLYNWFMLRKIDIVCGRVWENLKVVPLLLFLGPLKIYWAIKDRISKLRR